MTLTPQQKTAIIIVVSVLCGFAISWAVSGIRIKPPQKQQPGAEKVTADKEVAV